MKYDRPFDISEYDARAQRVKQRIRQAGGDLSTARGWASAHISVELDAHYSTSSTDYR